MSDGLELQVVLSHLGGGSGYQILVLLQEEYELTVSHFSSP